MIERWRWELTFSEGRVRFLLQPKIYKSVTNKLLITKNKSLNYDQNTTTKNKSVSYKHQISTVKSLNYSTFEYLSIPLSTII